MADMQRPVGQDAMSKNRTALNPTDMAFMKQTGQMSPDTTWAEFWQTGFGISPNDTLQEALPKLKQNAKKADPVGKMQSIARDGQQPPPPGGPQGARKPMPQGRKPMVQSGGLEGLVGQM